MAINIVLKNSSTPGQVPATYTLELGELAINTYDGKVYLKKDVNGTQTVVEVAGDALRSLSVASTNGFAGSSTGGTNPTVTLSTTANGVLKGENGALVAATAGTDYITPTAGTASWAINVVNGSSLSASYATNANFALTSNIATYAINAGNVISSSIAISSSYATSASIALIATSASYVSSVISSSYALNAANATIALRANTAGTATSSLFANVATTATSASFATNAATATSASFATNTSTAITATSASFATNSNTSISASFATRANLSNLSLVANNALTADNATNASTASFVSTASFASNSTSASYALTSSHTQNAISASYVLLAVSASHATIAESATVATRANTAGTATSSLFANIASSTVSASHAVNADNAISSSYASFAALSNTASYVSSVENASFAISSSYASRSFRATTSSYSFNTENANSALTAISSSFSTRAANATNADFASVAGYTSNALSASFATVAIYSRESTFSTSASYAETASYVEGSGGGGGVPGGINTEIQYNYEGAFGGVPVLTYDGITLKATGSFLGSLNGTSSWATNALTASSADNFTVRGTLTAQTIHTQVITSSVSFITGSTRFGSLSSDTHQFTGSVLITGSLTTTDFTVLADVFEFTGSVRVSGSITGSLYGTSSWAVSASWAPGAQQSATASYITSSNVYGPYGSDSILSASYAVTASSADDFTIRADVFEFTGSVKVSGSITGSLYGTASWAVSASWAPGAQQSDTASYVTSSNVYGPYGSNSILSASYAVTAAFASNVTSTFPYIGDAVITGSLTVTESGITVTGSLNVSGTTTTDRLTVGSNPISSYPVNLLPNFSGSSFIGTLWSNPTLYSGSVNNYTFIQSRFSTTASNFTASTVTHFAAGQGTIGAGSRVNSQYGFFASVLMNGAQNNYGFYGGLNTGASSSWNLYMIGTSPNVLAGNTAIGSTDTSTYKLNVVGAVRISGSSQFTGSLEASSITGSLLGTSSYSLTASYIDGGFF